MSSYREVMLLPLLLPRELSLGQPAEIPSSPKQHGIHQTTWLEDVSKPGGARRLVCISISFMVASTCDWLLRPTNVL